MNSGITVQVFAKYPKLGRVKTRLQPFLSEEESALLHRRLVNSTLDEVCRLPDYFNIELWGDEPRDSPFYKEILESRKRLLFARQAGKDLGKRMAFALRQGLKKSQRVIIIGTDCPVLTAENIERIGSGMRSNCLDIIPAEDGGYVLIGAMQYHLALFSGVSWGGAEVFEQTQEAVINIGWDVKSHDTLWDLDLPLDYLRYESEVLGKVND